MGKQVNIKVRPLTPFERLLSSVFFQPNKPFLQRSFLFEPGTDSILHHGRGNLGLGLNIIISRPGPAVWRWAGGCPHTTSTQEPYKTNIFPQSCISLWRKNQDPVLTKVGKRTDFPCPKKGSCQEFLNHFSITLSNHRALLIVRSGEDLLPAAALRPELSACFQCPYYTFISGKNSVGNSQSHVLTVVPGLCCPRGSRPSLEGCRFWDTIGNGDKIFTEKLGSQKIWHGIRESQDLCCAPGYATDPPFDLEHITSSLPGPVYP